MRQVTISLNVMITVECEDDVILDFEQITHDVRAVVGQAIEEDTVPSVQKATVLEYSVEFENAIETNYAYD